MGKGGGGGSPKQLDAPVTPAPQLPSMNTGGFSKYPTYTSQYFGRYPSISPYSERPQTPELYGRTPVPVSQAPVYGGGDVVVGAVGSPSATGGSPSFRVTGNGVEDVSDTPAAKAYSGKGPAGRGLFDFFEAGRLYDAGVLTQDNVPTFDAGKTPHQLAREEMAKRGQGTSGASQTLSSSGGKGPSTTGYTDGYTENKGFWDNFGGSLLGNAVSKQPQAGTSGEDPIVFDRFGRVVREGQDRWGL